ncbi:MAG: RNA polymerase sigma factor [Thermoguttaceae bacterium]
MDALPRLPGPAGEWDRPWPQTPRELEALVDAFLDRLVRYAYGRLGSLPDAEDVVQEVFVRSLSDRSGRSEIGMVGPYLYRSVANACTDLMRKRGSKVATGDQVDIDQVLDPREPSLGETEAADERRKAERLLGQLPPDQAEVVRLRVLEGLRLHEIARIVGCSANTVSSRLRYAFGKLRGLVLDREEAES